MGSLSSLMRLMDAEDDDEIADAMGKLSVKHRELLETSNANASYLVKVEVYDKVIEGAEKVLCMREVLKDSTFEMPTPSFRFILHETAATRILPIVPATGEYSVAPNESYRGVTFTAVKYGEIPGIEEELIADSMFDVVEMRLKDMGKLAENTLNQKAMDVVIANAGTDVNWSSGEPVSSISNAIRTIKDAGYSPDALVLSADGEANLFTDPHFRYEYSGETGNFRNAELGKKIMGLKPYILTLDSANGSFGGAIKAVVLDSSKAAGLGIREDIEVSEFEDPKNDLMNLKIRMRFDVEPFFKGAIVNLSS